MATKKAAAFGAAFSGNIADVSTFLKDHPREVNALSDDRQASLLYTAARFGHFALCFTLLREHGADVNARNGDGSTPLHGACFASESAVAALLLFAGADATAKNTHGATALDDAESPSSGKGNSAPAKKTQAVVKTERTRNEELGKAAKACLGIESLDELQQKLRGTAATEDSAPARKRGRVETAASAAAAVAPPPKAAPAAKVAAAAPKKAAAALAPAMMPGLQLSSAPGKPLTGHTVVFTGSFTKKKALLEQAVADLGGKTSGSVSGKTTLAVVGHSAGGKEYDAIREGAHLWTGAEFETFVAGGGAPPPKPVPAWGLAVFHNPKMNDRQKMKFLMSAERQWFDADGGHFWLESYGKYALTVGQIGGACLHDVLVSCKCSAVILNQEQNMTPDDVEALMTAMCERAAQGKPYGVVNFGGNRSLGEAGIQRICQHLAASQIGKIYLYGCGVTEAAAKLLVATVASAPALKVVEIDGPKEALAVLAAHNDAGGSCTFIVDNQKVTSGNIGLFAKVKNAFGF